MKSLTGKRVLVTDGAGSIGSLLCTRLIKAGHDVPRVDKHFTGRRSNPEQLLSNVCIEPSRLDIVFPLYAEVGGIYDLACFASPVYYRYPVQITKTTVHGT